jgi:hypothetical protein
MINLTAGLSVATETVELDHPSAVMGGPFQAALSVMVIVSRCNGTIGMPSSAMAINCVDFLLLLHGSQLLWRF